METINTLLAAFPLILILILMVGFRWNGAEAGTAGWAAALMIAALCFGAGPTELFWAQVLGVFRAVYVLYIIWGALFFFRVTEADGTLKAMSTMLQQISPERTLQVLLLAWGFASFLQGVGGFGVPVAVVAPILVSLGIPPLEAVVMPSLGHAWAISFGSLGASFEALRTATGLEGSVIAPQMAVALAVVCVLVGAFILWIAGGKKTFLAGAGPMLSMALTMSGVQYLAIRVGLFNIAAMLGALAGLLVGSIWALAQQNRPTRDTTLSRGKSLAKLAPYILLIVIIFAANFVSPLRAALKQVTLKVPQEATAQALRLSVSPTKDIALFGNPGALLVYAGLAAAFLAKRQGALPPGSGKQILQGMTRSGIKSTLGILTMVGMATTMENVGMISQLSQAMAQIAGQLFPLVSPFIGALGAFMTGSNTNSNFLFGAFQRDVAARLGYSIPIILAVHNAGAAVGSVFAPAKVIVGCSTVGLSGGESEALRRTTRYSLVIIVVLAVLALIATTSR